MFEPVEPLRARAFMIDAGRLGRYCGDHVKWLRTMIINKAGLRCVIEWETGNVSSSHRSMNKLCVRLNAGIIESGMDGNSLKRREG